eukprot:scaffold25_cov342-Pavlova_lutheri.AAC.54
MALNHERVLSHLLRDVRTQRKWRSYATSLLHSSAKTSSYDGRAYDIRIIGWYACIDVWKGT